VNAELERAFWVVGHASFPAPQRQAAFLQLVFTLMAGVDLKDADLTDANWWRARRLTSEQLA
jgi:hypothetical protein